MFPRDNTTILITTYCECVIPLLCWVCTLESLNGIHVLHSLPDIGPPGKEGMRPIWALYLHMVSIRWDLETSKSRVWWSNPEPGCLFTVTKAWGMRKRFWLSSMSLICFVIKIGMKSRDHTQVCVGVCVSYVYFWQGISFCDCLYSRTLLDLCQCSADYGPWRFISLNIFFSPTVAFACGSLFFSGHLLRRVVQVQS